MTETVLPIFAAVLSVASLGISLLNYLRDRPRIKAWAEIAWHRRGPTPDSEMPCLRIRIANLGRRPILLLNLRMKNANGHWSRTLKKPVATSKDPVSIDEVFGLLEEHVLAQNSAIRLAEGDVLDLPFWPDDTPDFIDSHADEPQTATALYVEDGAGRLHRVRRDIRALTTLFAAWAP